MLSKPTQILCTNIGIKQITFLFIFVVSTSRDCFIITHSLVYSLTLSRVHLFTAWHYHVFPCLQLDIITCSLVYSLTLSRVPLFTAWHYHVFPSLQLDIITYSLVYSLTLSRVPLFTAWHNRNQESILYGMNISTFAQCSNFKSNY